MNKTVSEFYCEIKNGVVTRVGKSVIEQPQVQKNEHHINWYEDKVKEVM